MASVTLHNARSEHLDADAAAEDCISQLGAAPGRVVFAFIPGDRDHAASHRALRARLPSGVRLVSSATTAGLTNGGHAPTSLVLGGLGGDLEIGIGFGTGLGTDPSRLGAACVETAARELGTRIEDFDRTVGGVVIDDGSRMRKEELLLGVLEKNQGLVVVGGGASKNAMGQGGVIGVDGEVFEDGAALVLFRTRARWAALRHHAYEPTGQRVRVTKFDAAQNRILELDGEPAALRAAAALGMPPEHLSLAHVTELLKVMFALRVGREYFLRFAFKEDGSNALISANWLQEGQDLELMKAGDMLAALGKFIDVELPSRVPSPTAALFFDCGARQVSAAVAGVQAEVGAAFRRAPACAGGVVYYESYCGFMVSGTLTSLVFGSDA